MKLLSWAVPLDHPLRLGRAMRSLDGTEKEEEVRSTAKCSTMFHLQTRRLI